VLKSHNELQLMLTKMKKNCKKM